MKNLTGPQAFHIRSLAQAFVLNPLGCLSVKRVSRNLRRKAFLHGISFTTRSSGGITAEKKATSKQHGQPQRNQAF